MSRFRETLRRLGPGIVAGAADDDPSGIATFSIAGAMYGNALLWFAWVSWPFMHAVQMMCARVGMATGRGLIGALEWKLPKPILVLASLALFAANTINIGADLVGMGEAAELATGLDAWLFVLLFGGFIGFATVRLQYRQIANILKWLALCLFAYVASAVRLGPDWARVLRDTFTFAVPDWSIVVGLIGCTFSPYFFIWQAAQEVEEKRDVRGPGAPLAGVRDEDLRYRRIDVAVGTFFSRIVLFFVILTTSLTLHVRGVGIESANDAAEALRPIAGPAATWLYALGLLGVGFLVIPVLSASAAYAFAEVFGWRHGLDQKLNRARGFYAVIIVSTVAGIAFRFTSFSPMQALFWSGVINGLIAPLLLIAVLLAAGDPAIMKDRVSPRGERITVAIAIAGMLAATAVWLVM
ncbi:MAG TPA: divalent metal cation transporter [Thermoanaerobaculia bacterium]